MTEERYLFRRNEVFCIRFRLPKEFGNRVFQKSLKTSKLSDAKKIRDRFVIPFLSSDNSVSILSLLISQTFSEPDLAGLPAGGLSVLVVGSAVSFRLGAFSWPLFGLTLLGALVDFAAATFISMVLAWRLRPALGRGV